MKNMSNMYKRLRIIESCATMLEKELIALKDIPVFTTEYGVASLVLKEIPDRGVAYVKLQASADPEMLLKECVEFCRVCGAEIIFASGDECLSNYPCTATLVQMQRQKEGIEISDASVFPVTDETVHRWREIYNEKMSAVPNASYMRVMDEKNYLADGDCYFVHRKGELLGIGKASGDTIHTIASVQAGAGKSVLLALASLLTDDTIRLTVAKENTKAVTLYERLGFVQVREEARWYKIL